MRSAFVCSTMFAGEFSLKIYLYARLILFSSHFLSLLPGLLFSNWENGNGVGGSEEGREEWNRKELLLIPFSCCFFTKKKFFREKHFSIFVMPFLFSLVTFTTHTTFAHSFMHRSYKFINIWLIGITTRNSAWIVQCTQKPTCSAQCNSHSIPQQLWSQNSLFLFFKTLIMGGSSKSQTRTNILFIFYLIFCFPSFTYISILMLVFPIRIVRCYTFYKNSLRQTLLCVGVVCSPNRAPLHCMDFYLPLAINERKKMKFKRKSSKILQKREELWIEQTEDGISCRLAFTHFFCSLATI